VVEVTESLRLLIHGCLDFIYPCHDFDSHFLKKLIYFFLVSSIRFFSCRKLSYLLKELAVVRERPMPEDGLDIAGCELGNRKEIFGLEGLFNYTKFAFENYIILFSQGQCKQIYIPYFHGYHIVFKLKTNLIPE